MTTEQSYERLREYADDLYSRFEQQKEWWARHPEYGPSNEIPDEVFEADPFPWTIITSERFLDLLIVALGAYRRPAVDDIKHDPDPLITQLRNMAHRENVFEWEASTFNEAADEIERLKEVITDFVEAREALNKNEWRDDSGAFRSVYQDASRALESEARRG